MASRSGPQRTISRRPLPDRQFDALPDDLHPILRRIYASRGLASADLDTSLSSMLPIGALDGTAAAAERLARARERQESVVVLGDFDADGATASALVVTCLRAFGFSDARYLVPNRFDFGYGLTPEIVEIAARDAPALIVTVDNGISSCDGARRAREFGIDVIVTDHHLPGPELPDVECIVNPNLPASEFASKSLAGVGVAFYVMAALGRTLATAGLIDADTARRACADCLDLVALGTVADLVPLDRNNRVLVAQGLRRIRSGRARPGIAALFDVAGRSIVDATAADLAFGVAPRLNAAGRLTDMSMGIGCLLTGGDTEARTLAQRLHELNAERRTLQAQMQEQAERIVDGLDDVLGGREPNGYCLFDARWHQGIVGLVATRIRERTHRPVIAFAPANDSGELKGSARSVKGINIRDVIADIAARRPELIGRFGGHAMAAGLTLPPDRIEAFRSEFDVELGRYADELRQRDIVWSDGELGAGDFELGLAETLRFAGPWGQGFPEPLFDNRFQVAEQRVVGGDHLKLRLRFAGRRGTIDAIAFNQPELAGLHSDGTATFAYRLDVNEYRERRSPQLVVEHIQYD